MKSLLDLARKNKIIIDNYELGTELLALYMRTTATKCPIIVLHRNLPFYSPLTRCVLAEELGHHFTMTGDAIHQHRKYGDIIHIGKIEKAALRWAGHQLVKDPDLYRALKTGQATHYWLAERFNVTEDFMIMRLAIFEEEGYRERYGIYQNMQEISPYALIGG